MSVDWEAMAITAQSSDFFPRSGTVEIAAGAASAELPLSIIDDSDPEFSETLSVSLVNVSGGARMGSIQTATITILSNDDPNGALGKICVLCCKLGINTFVNVAEKWTLK